MSAASPPRPFRLEIPQADLDDLKRRLTSTRWPAESPVAGWERGVPLGYLKELAQYWADAFDWRRREGELNELPQFLTTIEGQDVHFLHVRSPEAEALPLLMTHGWPSSPVEFLKVIAPLSDPGSQGGNRGDAFHLVIPSLPGYGFSPPPRRSGWGNLFGVARAWSELMHRLGYDRYAVHGTDVGTGVAGMLAMIDGPHLAGIHLTGTTAAMPLGPPVDPSGLSAPDRERAERFNTYRADGVGYLHLQATRPQTLAYSLSDSPAGQLAWIVEKFHEWTDPAVDLPDEAVDRDQLLTNASIFWFSGAGASSAHATYDGIQAWREMISRETGQASGGEAVPNGPPRAVAVFAADTTIRSLIEREGELARWSEFDRGGHFPAMEAPELLTEDLRSFFRTYRPREGSGAPAGANSGGSTPSQPQAG